MAQKRKSDRAEMKQQFPPGDGINTMSICCVELYCKMIFKNISVLFSLCDITH
jgi:hypothetical protein